MTTETGPARGSEEPVPHAVELTFATVCYWLTVAVVVFLAQGVFERPLSGHPAAHPVLYAGWLLALLAVWQWRSRRLWPAVWIALGAIFLGNVCFGWFATGQYGDSLIVSKQVSSGVPVPRGLAPTGLGTWFYASIFMLPPVAALFEDPVSASSFALRILSSLGVAAGSFLLLRRWPDRLSVLLPTLCPIWLLFAVGYIEQYPLAAVVFVAVLAWAFDRPLEAQSPRDVGIATGLLWPVFYFGFSPVAAVLLATYCITVPKQSGRAIGWATATAVAGVHLFWPGGVGRYFYMVNNFPVGAASIHYEPYAEHFAEGLPFFSSAFLWTGTHLFDWAMMWFLGAGLLGLPILVAALAAGAFDKLRAGTLLASLDSRVWLALGLWVVLVGYSFVMLPRFGPVLDVDLFFHAYLGVAFLAGATLDSAVDLGRRGTALVVAAALGNTAALSMFLVFVGV